MRVHGCWCLDMLLPWLSGRAICSYIGSWDGAC